jgi:hypothetical protein
MRFFPALFRGFWGWNRLLCLFFFLPMVEFGLIRVRNRAGIMPKLRCSSDILTGWFLESNAAALCHVGFASNSKDIPLRVGGQVETLGEAVGEAGLAGTQSL